MGLLTCLAVGDSFAAVASKGDMTLQIHMETQPRLLVPLMRQLGERVD